MKTRCLVGDAHSSQQKGADFISSFFCIKKEIALSWRMYLLLKIKKLLSGFSFTMITILQGVNRMIESTLGLMANDRPLKLKSDVDEDDRSSRLVIKKSDVCRQS